MASSKNLVDDPDAMTSVGTTLFGIWTGGLPGSARVTTSGALPSTSCETTLNPVVPGAISNVSADPTAWIPSSCTSAPG